MDIEEVHMNVVMSLVVAVTAIVQATKHARMHNVLIHAFTIILVHQGLNVNHKTIWLYADVLRALLEIHTSIVAQNQHQNANTIPIAHQDLLVSTINAQTHVLYSHHANYHQDVKLYHHLQYEQ